MKKTAPLLTVVALLAIWPGAGFAQTPPPGAKATALGGSFVASGNDATALWGNPALIAECSLGCATIFGGGIATDENSFARTLENDFSNLSLAELVNNPAKLNQILSDLQGFARPGTGTVGSALAGVGYASHGVAAGIAEYVYAGASPTIDLVHVTPLTLPLNTSSLTLRGIRARETRVGYAGKFILPMLTLGVDLRYIQGSTYFLNETPQTAASASNSIDLLREALRHNELRTNRFAYDAGAMLQPIPKLRLGLVGQNLNEPSFKIYNCSPSNTVSGPTPTAPCPETEVPLPRTIRAGAAFAPVSFDGIVFSLDADLNRQKTLVTGLESQRVGGGVQLYFLRVGAYEDTAAPDKHIAYTGGLNLSGHFFALEVSGVYSSNRRDVGASADLRLKL